MSLPCKWGIIHLFMKTTHHHIVEPSVPTPYKLCPINSSKCLVTIKLRKIHTHGKGISHFKYPFSKNISIVNLFSNCQIRVKNYTKKYYDKSIISTNLKH